MLNKIWCRIFQGVMKLANYFLGYRMPEYIEGSGSIAKLPQFMKEKGSAAVLLWIAQKVSRPRAFTQGKQKRSFRES